MSTKQINIGIIGCGARIKDLLWHMPEMGNSLELVAICDPEPRAIQDYQKSFNANAKVYDDYNELVCDPGVEWVFIGSVNAAHREHCCAAFAANKDVFCEKPLATTLEDCIAVKQAHEKSSSQFVVGFTLRFSPHYRKIKKLLDENRIGDIISFEFNETVPYTHGGHIHSGWRRYSEISGGHMLEKCCHDLDIANWIVGSRPARVASFGGKDFFIPANVHHMARIGKDANGKEAYCGWFGEWDDRKNPFTGDSNVIDNQVAIIEYENNVRATFHTNCNAGIPERRLYILGTEGAIRADVVSGLLEVQRIGQDEPLVDESAGVSGSHGGGDDILGPELTATMLQGTPPSVSLHAGYLSAITALGIEESRRKGTTIDMEPLWQQAGL